MSKAIGLALLSTLAHPIISARRFTRPTMITISRAYKYNGERVKN